MPKQERVSKFDKTDTRKRPFLEGYILSYSMQINTNITEYAETSSRLTIWNILGHLQEK